MMLLFLMLMVEEYMLVNFNDFEFLDVTFIVRDDEGEK